MIKRMKRLFLLPIFIIIGILCVINLFASKNIAHADTQYTCLPNGIFAAMSTGPAALTTSDTSRVANANNWLAGMLLPNVKVATNSTITPDQQYPDNYTGATSGSYRLTGKTYVMAPSSSIVVTSPSTVPDSYRGVLTGHVTMPPSGNRWIIQAYKNNNGVITQVPHQALADGVTGNFSIDLSTVSSGYTGQWMLGVLDANASYAEYGTKWPSPDYYVNIAVQELVVTDTTYLWASTPATVDGRFAFPNDQIGAKIFRLYDTSSGEVLAQSFRPTGLIRSYDYQPTESGYGTGIQDLTYVYDQALALYSATSQNQVTQAKLLVDGLLKMQTKTGLHTGGFVFAAPQLSPTYTNNYYRSGASALAVDALLTYIKMYPNDTNIEAYKVAALSGISFISSLYSSTGPTSGLYLGGFGDYSGNPQVFDPNYVVTFASTEHNLDIWHVFVDAAQVFGNTLTNYSQKAADLDTVMTTRLYNSSLNRFNQGINGGVADTGDALDINSWGAIQLYATNKITQAQMAVAHFSSFTYTVNGVSGFAPFYDSPGYPGAVANVWYEGTFGAALALYDTGNYSAYRSLINQLGSAQQTDGSFRYAEAIDTTYGIGVSRSVASTAWFILATVGRGSLWGSCTYSPASAVASVETPIAVNSSVAAQPKARSLPIAELSNNTPTVQTAPAITTPTQLNDAHSAEGVIHDTPKRADFNLLTAMGIAGGSLAVAGIVGFTIARMRRKDS